MYHKESEPLTARWCEVSVQIRLGVASERKQGRGELIFIG